MDSSDKNPYEKYIPLFEKWPHVTVASVQGEPGLRVSGWHDTPEGAKSASTRGIWAMIAWGTSLTYLLSAAWHHLQHNEYFGIKTFSVLAFIAFAVLSVLTYIVFDLRAQKKTVALISPGHIEIGGKTYDAKIQHKFTMDLHRKAKEEADAELRAQQRGKDNADIRHPRYYRDSYHIFFEYLGQRILIADIYKEENAEKFLRALVAVNKIVHKEKTVFTTNANAANIPSSSDVEETSEAKAERIDYFGKRPALD